MSNASDNPGPGQPTIGKGLNQGKGTAVLVLTVVAAFLSLGVGGCTASFFGGVADVGDKISDAQKEFKNDREAKKTRKEAKEIRDTAGSFAFYGFLGAVLGVAGGIIAYRNYDTGATFAVAGRTFKWLTLAGALITAAAVTSITNQCVLFSAGIVNTIAAILAFLQARRTVSS